MSKILKNKFFATGIGSVPYQDAKTALDAILKSFPDIPFWPQLPKRSFFENMYAQFIEGFPDAVINTAKKTLYIDTSKDLMKKLEAAYEKVLAADYEHFSISADFAEGFYELVNRLKSVKLGDLVFVKGQVTGPVSFGLSVTDENKKAILYNPELSELLTKILSLKVKFQMDYLKGAAERIIMFIDEPYLVSIGSSYVNIKRDDAAGKIKELVDTIHQECGLAAIHCCGNTDWSLVLKTGVDILNFDAYNFMKSVSLYPEELAAFLDRDGIIAWGIVPTSEAAMKETASGLVKRLEEGMTLLSDKKISKEKLLAASMITPSCGCGTLSIEETEKVFKLTAEVSALLRKKYSQPKVNEV